MSYEGFTEYLCPMGHYWTIDSGFFISGDPVDTSCPKCRKTPAFTAEVDETNGFYEEDPGTFSAPKVRAGSEDEWHTDHYGNRYAVPIPLFKPAPRSRWRKYE